MLVSAAIGHPGGTELYNSSWQVPLIYYCKSRLAPQWLLQPTRPFIRGASASLRDQT